MPALRLLGNEMFYLGAIIVITVKMDGDEFVVSGASAIGKPRGEIANAVICRSKRVLLGLDDRIGAESIRKGVKTPGRIKFVGVLLIQFHNIQ